MPEEDYIAFVDESGDPVLHPLDPQFPALVLAICLFRRSDYDELVLPQITDLKLAYFGRSDVVFHERDIRQRRGMFTSLGSEANRTRFLEDLTQTIDDLPFTVISAAIDKQRMARSPDPAIDLYQQCLRIGLMNAYRYLDDQVQRPLPVDVIVESRGRKEDRRLRELFDAFQRRSSATPATVPGFDLAFANKTDGHVGLELADLIAYPIARHVLGRPQAHDLFGLIRRKMFRGPDGEIDGYGLTIIGR